MLDEADRARVEAAVRDAELGTAGEIVVVVARQAASYKSLPLLYGLLVASVLPLGLIAFTELSAIRVYGLGLAASLAAVVAASVAGLRLVPPATRRRRARAAAAREFCNRGLADTRGRTGVLLFVALAERYGEVRGDLGISDRIAASEWHPPIDALVAELAAGRVAEGLVAAVGEIGGILARHVPPGSRPADELPNRVVVL